MSSDGTPPLSWYQPPEPVECCELWEDPEHDSEQCLADGAEAAAEARADRQREDMLEARWERDHA